MNDPIDPYVEELDFLDAVLAETEDDVIWKKAERRYKDHWCIIRSKDPKHPLVVNGEPWLQPGWGPPSKAKAIPLPGSWKTGVSLSVDDDDEKTDPGHMNRTDEIWGIDWFGNKSKEPSKPADLSDSEAPKEKTEGDKLMDFFFK